MNLNSGEIHRLNIKSLSLPLALLPLFCCLGGERLPALSTICLISSIAKLVFERLFALHSFVLTYSVVIVHGSGDIRLLFKLPLKFRYVLKHTESRGSLACNQRRHPHSVGGFALL